jgi:hypothetical protein
MLSKLLGFDPPVTFLLDSVFVFDLYQLPLNLFFFIWEANVLVCV